MENNIMERLATLRANGKRVYAIDIIRELRKKGIKTTSAEFSRYVNGVENPPKSDLVLAEADKIILGWENDSNRKD